ncbi:MAG: hypothetical protein FJ147_03275 [Deltaproteobacteria bacterium]|nr:hypothetical protein [Deltaproteobacteria bacterium]
MTESPDQLLTQTRQRLVRQRQINGLGVMLPIAIALVWCCGILVDLLALPRLLILGPLVMLGTWLALLARHTKRSVEQDLAATLIDEKTDSKDRFLTFSTASSTQTSSPLFPILQGQVAQKAAAFHPDRDVPFQLDRRVLVSWVGSTLCTLALIVLSSLFTPTGDIEASIPTSLPSITEQEIQKLEEAARRLTRQGAPPQEQAAGQQLRSLAEKLKDPTLSQEEKQQLIEETQKKIQLSMPQILPFDLKIFANDSKNDSGDGNQSEKQKQDGKSSGKSNDPSEQGKGTSSSGSGEQQQQQPGTQETKQSDNKNQPQPKESGGGIKFNQPQQQSGEKKEDRGQGPGEQQQSAQNQAPNSNTPGSDPNRPGGQDQSNQDQEKKGETPNPQQSGQGEGGKGPTSGGRGERFSQPGEQPGGFLTKDARFVKVRIPTGNEPQGKGDTLTDNDDAAQPKTPYSNAPLKDAPASEIQPKQPIPLEYRTILK